MALLQLSPPLPIVACVEGTWWKGHAHIVIDPGQESDLQWVCFLDHDGECYTVRNQDLRLQPNVTMGRARKKVIPIPARCASLVTEPNANDERPIEGAS